MLLNAYSFWCFSYSYENFIYSFHILKTIIQMLFCIFVSIYFFINILYRWYYHRTNDHWSKILIWNQHIIVCPLWPQLHVFFNSLMPKKQFFVSILVCIAFTDVHNFSKFCTNCIFGIFIRNKRIYWRSVRYFISELLNKVFVW